MPRLIQSAFMLILLINSSQPTKHSHTATLNRSEVQRKYGETLKGRNIAILADLLSVVHAGDVYTFFFGLSI